MMNYLQITVTTTTEFSDIVAMALSDLGSDGVSIIDFNDIKETLSCHNWDYADESLFAAGDGRVFVNGFFNTDFDIDIVIKELEFYKSVSELATGSLEITAKQIKSQDWENEWRKYYSCIELNKVVIVPEWLNYTANKDMVQVRLDPGMAFGTGSHETTALCIRLMQEFDLKNKHGADVGCGSGILGIAAIKLGAQKCTFVDIDPLAIDATKSNCALNNVSDSATIELGNLLDSVGYKLDFVVANITANVLLILLDDIAKALNKGGKLVISGIINKFANQVYEAYSTVFTPLNRINDGEWNAMLFER